MTMRKEYKMNQPIYGTSSIIGKGYFKNIYKNVLGELSKELLALQGELITLGDEEAKEIYSYFFEETEKILRLHMENESKSFRASRDQL